MTFPLAGLLRVRELQERLAAERLSHATAERAEAEDARDRVSSSLADIAVAVGDPRMLLAMAAARSAGSSALSDLQALSELRRQEEDRAKSAHVEARRELKGLERLELAHRTRTAKAQRDAEQTAIDEIAVVRSARREGSAA